MRMLWGFMRALLVLTVMLLSGCGSNPFDPIDPYENQPSSVKFKTFEETVASLDTSYKIEAWLNDNARYTGNISGWGDWLVGSEDDNTKTLAYSFWKAVRENDWESLKNGGTCGLYAGFFAYCMRENGYKAGGGITDDGTHAYGWAVEKDGTVTIVDVGLGADNCVYYKFVDSYEQLVKNVIANRDEDNMYNSKTGLTNDRFVLMSDEEAMVYGLQ